MHLELSQIQRKIDINKSLLMEYSKQRDEIDKKIENLVEILTIELDYENKLVTSEYTGPVPDNFLENDNKNNINVLEAPLVDASGFPLPNVNLHLVTESRSKIRSFQNDRKKLDEKIEVTMVNYHGLLKDKKGFGGKAGTNDRGDVPCDVMVEDVDATSTTQPQAHLLAPSSSLPSPSATPHAPSASLAPFLIINSITSDSPSAHANLRVYDKIVKFGDIKIETFIGLKQIGEYVSRNEDQQLTVAFIRPVDGENMIQFTSLVPKKWAGKGLLGCVVNTL